VSYQGATVYVHARLKDGTSVTCATTPELSRRATVEGSVGLRPAGGRAFEVD
jgi:putative spermidine/putrescine transport system ATP-binding protein